MINIRSRLIETIGDNQQQDNIDKYHEHEKDKLVLISSSNREEWIHYISMILKN